MAALASSLVQRAARLCECQVFCADKRPLPRRAVLASSLVRRALRLCECWTGAIATRVRSRECVLKQADEEHALNTLPHLVKTFGFASIEYAACADTGGPGARPKQLATSGQALRPCKYGDYMRVDAG